MSSLSANVWQNGAWGATALHIRGGLIEALEPLARDESLPRVTPAWVDAHGHIALLAERAHVYDLSRASSFDDLRMLKDLEATHTLRSTAAPWVIATGFSAADTREKRLPSADELGELTGGRAVMLRTRDEHAAVLSRPAWDAVWPEFVAALSSSSSWRPQWVPLIDGKPSGAAYEGALDVLAPLLTALAETSASAMAQAMKQLLRAGIGTVHEMSARSHQLQPLAKAAQAEHLRVRAFVYAQTPADLRAAIASAPADNEWFRVEGVKIFLDGALGSRGAHLIEPYADCAGHHGLRFSSTEHARAAMAVAREKKLATAIHAIGDAAVRDALDLFAEQWPLEPWEQLYHRRVEHAQVVQPSDLPRFSRLSVMAGVQFGHEVDDRTFTRARLGPHRAAHAWSALRAAGAELLSGSDFPVSSPSPRHTVAALVSRPTPTLPLTELTRCLSHARACSGDAVGFSGELTAGCRADLAVFDAGSEGEAPDTWGEYSPWRRDPVRVMMGGQWVVT